MALEVTVELKSGSTKGDLKDQPKGKKRERGGRVAITSYIDQLIDITFFQIAKYRCFIQIGQVRHILSLLILWWIDLLQ